MRKLLPHLPCTPVITYHATREISSWSGKNISALGNLSLYGYLEVPMMLLTITCYQDWDSMGRCARCHARYNCNKFR